MLLTLLGIAPLDVVKGIELDGEGFSTRWRTASPCRRSPPCRPALTGRSPSRRRGIRRNRRREARWRWGRWCWHRRRACTYQTMRTAPCSWCRPRCTPSRCSRARCRGFLSIVVGDDKGETVGAVTNSVGAAALRRNGDFKFKVGLESVPHVHFAVPPHRADALRGAEIELDAHGVCSEASRPPRCTLSSTTRSGARRTRASSRCFARLARHLRSAGCTACTRWCTTCSQSFRIGRRWGCSRWKFGKLNSMYTLALYSLAPTVCGYLLSPYTPTMTLVQSGESAT